MLARHDHPLGQHWYCGECGAKVASAHSCDECHNLLCDDCAPRTHSVPCGPEAGKICLLVIETVNTAAA